MRNFLICLIASFSFLTSLNANCCGYDCEAPAACTVYPDLSGFVIGFQGGWSYLMTPDVRDRTIGAGLRGYERISNSWGAFAGYNWTVCRCFFLGLQAAYFDNGYAHLTYDSSNQYHLHSMEWDILAQFGYISSFGYDAYIKVGGGRVKEIYKRVFAFTAAGDPESSKHRICPILAFGLGKILPCKIHAFLECKLTIAKDTSKVTNAFENINPSGGFTDVLNEVATVSSLHLGVSKSF